MSGLTPHRFDRAELAGSLGDLGTLLPLAVAMIALNGLNATATLVGVGAFYIVIGAWFRLPLPVQPFKVVAAVALAQGLSGDVVAAGGLWMAALLLLLGATELMTPIARLFKKPVVRGIQLAVGLGLAVKGGQLILDPQLFLHGPASWGGAWLNPALGVVGCVLALALLNNRRLPAALVLVVGGALAGLAGGALQGQSLSLGGALPRPAWPPMEAFGSALLLLALPQLPLTLGNAVISTADTAQRFFGPQAARRVTPRALCLSMGLANAIMAPLGGLPCCHGAGGLAAHYRFGARSGGSNLMIGAVIALMGLLLGESALPLLGMIPRAVLGVLLAFAGLELALLVSDLRERRDFFVALLIAGASLATGNLGIAFVVGLATDWALRRWPRLD